MRLFLKALGRNLIEMNKAVVPSDSRYIPFTQQRSCCVPTCIQMVMYRHNIHLIPSEELGYYLGLVVSPERASLFYNVRTSDNKPSAGYGTQIYNPEFEPSKVFKKLGIPLTLTIKPINKFNSKEEIINYLKNAESSDEDILLCFNHGALTDDLSSDWGHVCVFDRIVGDMIRMVDPSPDSPKWRLVSIEKMFTAMKEHGEKKSRGFWEIETV